MIMVVFTAAAVAIAAFGVLIAELRGRPVQLSGRITHTPATEGVWAKWLEVRPWLRTATYISVPVGVVLAAVTGWFPAVLLVPGLFAGVPALLVAPPTAMHISKLDALAEWARALKGVVGSSGLQQSIRMTQRSAPDAIYPEITALVNRLDSQVPLDEALDGLADDLDDAIGDSLVAKLKVAATCSTASLGSVLGEMADQTSEEVNVRRAIEAERKGPRSASRIITVIFLLMAGFLFTKPDYTAPYSTPLGQVLLVVIILGYAGCLIAMRKMVEGTPAPRFMGQQVPEAPR